MDDLTINYRSMRSFLARFAVVLQPSIKFFPALIVFLLISGAVLLILFGDSLGWLPIAVAPIVFMVWVFYKWDLSALPKGRGDDITRVLSSDVLGRLSAKPTLNELVDVVAHTSSGQFISARLGVTPQLVRSLAVEDPNAVREVIQIANDIRKDLGFEFITGGIIAVAIVRRFQGYETILAQMHIDDADLTAGLEWYQQLFDIMVDRKKQRRTGGVARDWSFGWIPLLSRFGQNISQGSGRSLSTASIPAHRETIDQLIDTFSSGGKQNAALVGASGVGKTTLIHAFADELIGGEGSVPDNLRFRQIFILDSSALISAAPGRGELENLVMRILNEAYNAKNIIVCLDNAQLFFEEGVGAVDLTNVLLPILEAGNLRIILAMDEHKFLEVGQRNPGLANAVNRINIPPTDRADTLAIMREQMVVYEASRNVVYMYQALKEAYRLGERYIHDLAMPGRALKLLESAASYSESGLVTVNSVQKAIEKSLDVKVSVASDSEDRERLLNMEQLIHERMVNQQRAVSVVSDALRRARAGVRNQNRPIGTFLFLGPTGVGKTELSKALADVYFGGEDRMIRLDMNEFVQSSDVARLIADGARNTGSLTARAMKQPFSVVLLDEIEKAAPEVLATLLQLLDEGILRDEKNREVSFRDAIVIATSNAGAARIREFVERGLDVSQFEKQFVDELIQSNQFRPEFLNRFDEIVVFRPFTSDELLQVLDLMLIGVNKTLALQKISVQVEDGAKQLLVEQGHDPRLGARPMRRVVQKAVENTIAKLMLSGAVNPGDVVTITREQVEEVFRSNTALGD